ncbi:MAG TPA: alpha-hydroxy acid oxidase [Nitriliruptorales bacterium]|nr:alpha-hydroxy acid oxidase [Nitriliruptorales bacterium]
MARSVMGAAAYDYYAGGADDELTLADNVAAWGRLRLRPHVLRDVSTVDTSTTVLGTPVRLPVLVAPTAYQRLAHDDGEAATARGAAAAGTVMVVSTLATVSLEEVAVAAPDAARWFQLYVRKDRGWSGELVARAAAAGYRALVFTVDLPVLGRRRRDEGHGFSLPEGMEMANIGQRLPSVEGSGIAAYATDELDPALTFDDIGWVKQRSGGLPVLVKGVLRGDDARDAVAAGADGVIVSNHGGRQLDGAVATADALHEVVDAVGAQAEVYVDGGIRRGTDVVRALALGARAVLVGRPVLWGLATGGDAGVRAVLEELGDQLQRALAMCGLTTATGVPPDLVVPTDPSW